MGVTDEPTTMTTFELWVHKELQEVAVRIDDGVVTGIARVTLQFACHLDGRLPFLNYDSSDAALYQVRHHIEQFYQFEPTLRGRYVPVSLSPPRDGSA